MRRTSIRRSISLHPGQNGRCTIVFFLKKNPKSECPDIGIRLPRHKWLKSWSSMEDPLVYLERNFHGHPLAGLLWERQFENMSIRTRLVKRFQMGNASSQTKNILFLSVYVDDIKLVGKKQNIDPMWKVLLKHIDLGEPSSFLDHV